MERGGGATRGLPLAPNELEGSHSPISCWLLHSPGVVSASYCRSPEFYPVTSALLEEVLTPRGFYSHARLCWWVRQRSQRIPWRWGSVVWLCLTSFHAALAGVKKELVKLGTVEGVRRGARADAGSGAASVQSSL